MTRKYPCPLATDKDGCHYGGNKVFNYGFMSGTRPYCRMVKRWVRVLLSGEDITCPLVTIKAKETK